MEKEVETIEISKGQLEEYRDGMKKLSDDLDGLRSIVARIPMRKALRVLLNVSLLLSLIASIVLAVRTGNYPLPALCINLVAIGAACYYNSIYAKHRSMYEYSKEIVENYDRIIELTDFIIDKLEYLETLEGEEAKGEWLETPDGEQLGLAIMEWLMVRQKYTQTLNSARLEAGVED